MSWELLNAMNVSANGMRAHGHRIRVITENVANAQTTGDTPGADPYRRQQITFENELDRQSGVRLVHVDKVIEDKKTPFNLEYNPDHPAANAEGYVKTPNINTLLELSDMKEAQRTYEANLGMIEQSRTMVMRTIDLLR